MSLALSSPQPQPQSPALFPLFLRLEGRRVLLVGGGKVAAAKLPALLEAGAQVTVVAPEVGPELARPGVELRRRPFQPEDLQGVWLVVSASTGEVNRQVAAAAERAKLWVNAVDDPSCGGAFTAGVLRRGGVTVAVSTHGVAPALAGLLREALEAVLPPELEAWVATAKRLREEQRAQGVPLAQRRPLLLEALVQLYARRGGAGGAR